MPPANRSTKVKDLEVSYDLLRFALQKAHQEGGLYANGLENMAGTPAYKLATWATPFLS
jgi:hypothetical protein